MKNGLFFILGIILLTSCDGDDPEAELNISDIPDDFVAKYALNGDATDDSKYQNDGEIIGNVTATLNRNETPNSAMFFDGEYSYIEIGDVAELKLTDSISISVWVKVESLIYPWGVIVNKWEDEPIWGDGYIEGYGYFLGINPEGSKLRWNISDNIVVADSTFPLNTWTHIVVTFNGTILKMYLDGMFINEYPFEDAIIDNDAPFRIGHQSEIFWESTNFHGAIDDVIIYDRALKKNEIDLLFNVAY